MAALIDAVKNKAVQYPRKYNVSVIYIYKCIFNKRIISSKAILLQ